MTRRRLSYLEFLESTAWWNTRKQVLQRANYRCERCPAPASDVHHRDGWYGDLGCERLDDLEALCDPCHAREHEPKNRTLRVREVLGQARLFDRWDDPDPPMEKTKAA
jgi:5-methylcytosine-specific restriction endonuclease McrA